MGMDPEGSTQTGNERRKRNRRYQSECFKNIVLIDRILILSLEKDRERRERLRSLIESESDKNLIKKTDFVKGVHFSNIDKEFLASNNFDYYKEWTLTESECNKIAKKYHNGSSVSDYPCKTFYRQDLKRGQLGCIIGHIQCWRQIISNGYDSALILEDDSWWDGCLSEELEYLNSLNLEKKGIDFCFLGREPHLDRTELNWAIDSKYVVPDYSYNSHSYILTYSGAIKLLSQRPHRKLMSTDEFLAAAYCDHPRDDLKKIIDKNLNAISLKEALIYQASSEHTGHEGISVSNIEDSGKIDET